ncbi:MAG: four helix bundle protein [Bacteroidota bacterium]
MIRKIGKIEDLEVWRKAMQVAVDIYTAMSISSNIAEGFEYNMKYLRKFEKGRNNLWNHSNHSNSSS